MTLGYSPPTFVGNQKHRENNRIGQLTKHMNGWCDNKQMQNRQRKYCIIETNCKHSEGGYGRLPLGDVYTCHGFLQITCKFEEVNSKTFFLEFIQQFVDA
jgi:hypothetical protein